ALVEGEERQGAAVEGGEADGAVEGVMELADDGLTGVWARRPGGGKVEGHGAYSGSCLRQQTAIRVGPCCSAGMPIPAIKGQEDSRGCPPGPRRQGGSPAGSATWGTADFGARAAAPVSFHSTGGAPAPAPPE